MKKIIPLIKLATQLAGIQRTVGYRDGHFENDAEHSYQLALVCWSANSQYNLGLNDELILKFSLVHDLVEVYSGDVDAFDSEEKIKSKKENEAKSFQMIKQDYGDFPEMIHMIQRYEQKVDLEARLVYILDKIIVDVNIYIANGDYYKKRKLTIEDWKKWLLNKIDYDNIDVKIKFLVDEFIFEVENKFKDVFY